MCYGARPAEREVRVRTQTMNIDSETPTKPSERACSHVDMAGDSLIEVRGPYHRCTSCSASWTDKELVIVNDETPVAA